MKEYSVTSLLSNYQIINIKDDDGNTVKELKFTKLSANRTFEIAEKYNDLVSDHLDTDEKDMKKSRKIFDNLIDLCFDIIRPKKLSDRIKNRFSKNYVSKKWLMDSFDVAGVNKFINTVLEPITGEKKT